MDKSIEDIPNFLGIWLLSQGLALILKVMKIDEVVVVDGILL